MMLVIAYGGVFGASIMWGLLPWIALLTLRTLLESRFWLVFFADLAWIGLTAAWCVYAFSVHWRAKRISLDAIVMVSGLAVAACFLLLVVGPAGPESLFASH